nr:glutamine synthetase III [Bradyrhizobium sp. DOA9]
MTVDAHGQDLDDNLRDLADRVHGGRYRPFISPTGSGCHVHVSLWKGERNPFEDEGGELGVSELGYHFLGGLINSADAPAAILNPSVNSCKRINAPRTVSGRHPGLLISERNASCPRSFRAVNRPLTSSPLFIIDWRCRKGAIWRREKRGSVDGCSQRS